MFPSFPFFLIASLFANLHLCLIIKRDYEQSQVVLVYLTKHTRSLNRAAVLGGEVRRLLMYWRCILLADSLKSASNWRLMRSSLVPGTGMNFKPCDIKVI